MDGHAFTALPIAAARVSATRAGIVSDPIAAKLLAGRTQLLASESANTGYMATRAALGDELSLAQHADGVRQIVLIGAGMDSRAFRLDLPGTTVFEVDSQSLFDTKEPLVADIPLRVEERRAVVGFVGKMNLAAALRANGHDPNLPTTWLLEGLLPYLTRDVAVSMAEDIGELSAPGSALWGDGFSKTSVDRGMSFHGVPFESGFDDYDTLFRERGGFDDARAYDMNGVNVDRRRSGGGGGGGACDVRGSDSYILHNGSYELVHSRLTRWIPGPANTPWMRYDEPPDAAPPEAPGHWLPVIDYGGLQGVPRQILATPLVSMQYEQPDFLMKAVDRGSHEERLSMQHQYATRFGSLCSTTGAELQRWLEASRDWKV